MSWRDDFAPLIAKSIEDSRQQGIDDRAIRRQLRAWFVKHVGSAIGYWPEKVYRDEVRRQLAGETGLNKGKRRPLPAQSGQLLLEGLIDGEESSKENTPAASRKKNAADKRKQSRTSAAGSGRG